MSGQESIRLESERPILRRFAHSDLAPFLAYRNDPEVARYRGWDSCTGREALDFIRGMGSSEPGTPGEWFQFAVELKGGRTYGAGPYRCFPNSSSEGIPRGSPRKRPKPGSYWRCAGTTGLGRVRAVTGEQGLRTAPTDGGHRGGAGSQWCNRLPADVKGGGV